MSEIRYSCQAHVTTTPDGRRYLLVQLTMQCPICGEITMEIPGHHLFRVVELLREQLLVHADLASLDYAKAETEHLKVLMDAITNSKEIKH